MRTNGSLTFALYCTAMSTRFIEVVVELEPYLDSLVVHPTSRNASRKTLTNKIRIIPILGPLRSRNTNAIATNYRATRVIYICWFIARLEALVCQTWRTGQFACWRESRISHRLITDTVLKQLLVSKNMSRFDGVLKKITRIPKRGHPSLAYDLFRPSTVSQTPPLVFLHGILGNRKHNRHAGKTLAENLKTSVLLPDLTNHGDSLNTPVHSYKGMSEDLAHLFREPALKETFANGYIMIGHSMGGKTAMYHALDYPDLVKAVITVDNIPYKNPEETSPEFGRFSKFFRFVESLPSENGLSRLEDVDRKLKELESDATFRKFLVSNFGKHKSDSFYHPKIPGKVLEDSLKSLIEFDVDPGKIYSGPLLIIRALNSPFVGTVDRPAVEKHFPNFDVVDFNTTHWVISDDEAGFVSAVKNWLSDQDLAG
ncbi:hypothetical protein OGAPHI_004488 [Ogataea philodendri]|uniref:AB hydrolase-1 domain-containing protein n=1 Tax=Ogataea philodendri TaxID=1378263 RepID=A0A9P8P7W2_9ASCO|nr:uncharacterized protein OGAPHI_004488 [Ogataea philodendri]KAH3666299.1 hypothetical protein OGAPHI_004488 [Ogataea philodendri]